MIDFTTFANFRAIDPKLRLLDRLAYLGSLEFRTVTRSGLWEMGLDYGDDDYDDGWLEYADLGDSMVVRWTHPKGVEYNVFTDHCRFGEDVLDSWIERYTINAEAYEC